MNLTADVVFVSLIVYAIALVLILLFFQGTRDDSGFEDITREWKELKKRRERDE